MPLCLSATLLRVLKTKRAKPSAKKINIFSMTPTRLHPQPCHIADFGRLSALRSRPLFLVGALMPDDYPSQLKREFFTAAVVLGKVLVPKASRLGYHLQR